jgi:hypothetical protein
MMIKKIINKLSNSNTSIINPISPNFSKNEITYND